MLLIWETFGHKECKEIDDAQVAYNIQGWLDKNKDPIQECVVQLMAEAKEPLVSLFFKDPEEGLCHTELVT